MKRITVVSVTFVAIMVAGILLSGVKTILAWTGPTAAPPSANVAAPVNVGSTAQVKSGNLGVNGLAVYGNALVWPGTGTGGYLNFDYTAGGTSGSGTGGYGIQDNAGTLMFKNFGGSWQSLSTIIGNYIALNGGGGWTTSGTNIYNSNTGNVGINTSNPRAKLEINGGILNTTAYNGNVNLASYDVGVGSIGAGTSIYSYGSICTGNASGACNGAGGVVLGNANTSATINITGGTSFFKGGALALGTATPYNGGSRLTIEAVSAPATWSEIVNYNNGAPTGSYGIYTYGSSYSIYANGPAYLTQIQAGTAYTANAGWVDFGTSIYGGYYYYTNFISDERLKKDISGYSVPDTIGRIMQLNPIRFHYKDAQTDKNLGPQIGFIAQDVEKLFPDLVQTETQPVTITNSDGSTETIQQPKRLEYDKFVVPLVVGEQELQKEIQNQQQEIDELKAEINALKASR